MDGKDGSSGPDVDQRTDRNHLSPGPSESEPSDFKIRSHDVAFDGATRAPPVPTETTAVVSCYSRSRHLASTALTTFVSSVTSAIDSWTYYSELRNATCDDDYERILKKLRDEWYRVNTFLMYISMFDVLTISFSRIGTLFPLGGFAEDMVVISSGVAYAGVFSLFKFFWQYNMPLAGLQRIKQNAALSPYETFVFFSLSAQLPLIAFFISVAFAMLCMFSVAWDTFVARHIEWSELLKFCALTSVIALPYISRLFVERVIFRRRVAGAM